MRLLPILPLLAALLVALSPSPAAGADAPVRLVVNADVAAFSDARVGEALARELGSPVVGPEAPGAARGTVTITWRPSRGELAVSWQEGERGTVSRVVPAPADLDAAVATGVQLAGNLVRSEADELLGPRRAPSPPSLAPPPAPPAAPPPVVVAAPAPASPPSGRPSAPVVVSFFHPLATNFAAPDVRTRLALGLVYSRVGQLDGAQLGGVNVVGDGVAGAQLAFGWNSAGAGVLGFQAALGLNVAGADVEGFQASGVLNRAAGTLAGLQFAFGVNSAGGVRGAQAAAVNVSGDVTGLQLGFVNVARKVKGVQLGLVNVADDVEGIPIGLISVTESGGVHPTVWASSAGTATLGLKFATRYTYTTFSGTARREEDDAEGDTRTLFGPGLALGFRVPMGQAFFDVELGSSYLVGGALCCISEDEAVRDDQVLTRARALLGVSLRRHFSVYFGTGLLHTVRFDGGDGDDARFHLGPELFAGIEL